MKQARSRIERSEIRDRTINTAMPLPGFAYAQPGLRVYGITQRTVAAPLLHGKDVHRASLRNVEILSGKQPVQHCLHASRIDAPSRLDRNELLASPPDLHRP